MVGDRHRGELQLGCLLHEPVEATGAIEERKLGVQMKMNKVRVRHNTNLASHGGNTKKQSFERFDGEG
jgi:hypothetical protein